MEILLTSETFVKSVTNISDNLSAKYLLPSIREVQEVNLRQILGDCLLTALKDKVADDSILTQANVAYHDLLDRCQYFLAYRAICEIIPKVSHKIANSGLVKTSDENVQNSSQDEIVKNEYYYLSKADSYALLLQKWILENRAAFPELRECDCNRIQANLHSAASCGLWLGGVRGKRSIR